MPSETKWLLICYMKDGSKRYIGPFKTRALAQFYARNVVDVASSEAEYLISPPTL